MSTGERPIVWFPGVDWDAVAGTDRRIVEELAEHAPIVWVDPANRGSWAGWLRGRSPAVSVVGNVTRIRVPATVGVSRWPLRALTRVLRAASYHRAVRGLVPRAVVVANPITPFPRTRAPKVLYVTDDWVSGAALMGFDRGWVTRILRRNARRATAVAAVSPTLLDSVGAPVGVAATVIPNGAPTSRPERADPRAATAGMVGQINERLDLALVEAVVDEGVPVRIVGPYKGQDTAFARRWERLVARPEVDWRGPVDASEIAGHLAEVAVGLTPYVASSFNRGSSPLKTFEYLAAGIAVVSSDLPASRWLDTPDVVVCADPASFGAAAREAVARRGSSADEERRKRFARAHSWSRRADDMLSVIDAARARRTPAPGAPRTEEGAR
jgi:teichuronic acid biosynthesis glycosyltransferase TuaH